VKTTLELPDELMRAVKIRAVNEGRRLKDVLADLIRRGLAQEPGTSGATGRRVRLPLVECAHDARPEEEITPDRVAEVQSEEEARAVRESA
jgi:plasmid stability protein